MPAPAGAQVRVATTEPSELPHELGRYKLIGELASGGMARVYVGRQVGAAGFERIVAIKCCHEHLRRNRAFAEMFLDEARLAAHIRHHNVVATLDASDGDPLYLVMEYVEGCSLAALACAARRARRLVPRGVVLRIVCDALAGLHAAHESCGPDGEPLGLVHCDVSPQNILVGVDGSARITDFGIARATKCVTLEDSVIRGKPSYMAPEQIESGVVSRRADVFSAGVVLWELLTGTRLFRYADDWATMNAVRTCAVAAPSSVEPSVPPALDAVLQRALERDPAQRFASAGEFLAALERLPLPVATARGVGEYVRREGGASLSPGKFPPSGKYPRAVAAEAQRLHDPSAEAVDDGHPGELTTRRFEPPRELVAASAREPEASVSEAYWARRMIIAISLVLVGCAVGLLVARQPAPSDAPSAAPVSVEPKAPSAPEVGGGE